LGLSLEDAALGIYRIACRHMIDAIRLGSVSRGYDPRDFVLVAFGGAGAAFAAEIARELGIPRAVVPPHPGVGAAAGLLSTDIRYDYMASHWADLAEADLTAVADKYRTMAAQARRELARDGFADEAVTVAFHADCRYRGQGYELGVEAPADFGNGWKGAVAEAFHHAHERHYLRRFADAPVQLVNLRATGIGRVPAAGNSNSRSSAPSNAGPGAEASAEAARIATRAAVFPAGDGWVRAEAAVYRRARLAPGAVLDGPAIVEQEDTTIVVPPEFRAIPDAHGHLTIEEGR
ncbi:MAG: hydantoinase/oxoprolinase family protein, partial [Rhodospirillaceae bacterium]|nr:hydantoinase/oxoprolinase family protein [Rhodospirillaceae bacterium]